MILKIKCLLVALAFVSALVFCADEDKSDPSLFALVSKQPPSQERPLKEKLSFPDFITTSLDFQKLLFLKLRSDELKNINLVCKAFYNAVDALQVDRPITLRNIYDISDGDQIEAPTILKNIRHVKKFRIQRGGFFQQNGNQPKNNHPFILLSFLQNLETLEITSLKSNAEVGILKKEAEDYLIPRSNALKKLKVITLKQNWKDKDGPKKIRRFHPTTDAAQKDLCKPCWSELFNYILLKPSQLEWIKIEPSEDWFDEVLDIQFTQVQTNGKTECDMYMEYPQSFNCLMQFVENQSEKNNFKIECPAKTVKFTVVHDFKDQNGTTRWTISGGERLGYPKYNTLLFNLAIELEQGTGIVLDVTLKSGTTISPTNQEFNTMVPQTLIFKKKPKVPHALQNKGSCILF